jgi:hypothetical protein
MTPRSTTAATSKAVPRASATARRVSVLGCPLLTELTTTIGLYSSVSRTALGIQKGERLLQAHGICGVSEIGALPPHCDEILVFEPLGSHKRISPKFPPAGIHLDCGSDVFYERAQLASSMPLHELTFFGRTL